MQECFAEKKSDLFCTGKCRGLEKKDFRGYNNFMAAKKNFRVKFDAPVTLVFFMASFLVLVLDKFVFKSFALVESVFSSPGALAKNAAGAALVTEVFNFSSPGDYARLFLYVFGNPNFAQFFLASAFILPLGSLMEERYGSPAVALMMLVSAFVAGVLNACLLPRLLVGSGPVIFMLILLSSITSISKREISLSSVLIFLVCMGSQFHLCSINLNSYGGLNKFSVIQIFIQLAGGLAASLSGFLTAPKARRASAKTASEKNAESRLEEIDASSPRGQGLFTRAKKERESENKDSDTTVIGSINI